MLYSNFVWKDNIIPEQKIKTKEGKLKKAMH
jgi:hypothetical protein